MPRTAFVGRDDELGELLAIAAALAGGDAVPGLVLVTGEAGMGKTRLLDELVASVPPGIRTVRGRADELDPVAFGLWRPVLAQLDVPRPGTDPSVPVSEQRWEVVDLLAAALRDAAPTLVVLDDLHWADDDSLWVCEQLVDRLTSDDLAVMAATRPGAESRSARWPSLHRRARILALRGLGQDDVAALAVQLGVDPGGATGLADRTGGNPLFVREHLLTGSGSVPTTVDALLRDAIDRLGPTTAGLVSTLATAGGDVPPDVLAAATGRSTAEVADGLADARRVDLLIDDGGQLRFRHDLLAEVAARRLDDAERGAVHLRLSTAWEQADHPDAALRAARHLVLAVPAAAPMAAAERSLAAAVGLRRSGRSTDAAALLLLARTTLPAPGLSPTMRARLALAEAELRWDLDDWDAATAASTAALAEVTEVDVALAAAIEVVSLQHHNPFAPDPVRVARVAQLDEALGQDPTSDPALRLRLRGRRAFLALAQPGAAAEAAALGDEVVAEARRLGDPNLLVEALRDRCFVLRNPADHALRAAAAAEILELARSMQRPDLALLGYEWTYASRIASGDLIGALGALDDLEALAAIMPSPFWRYSSAVRRSGACAFLGDYEGAVAVAGATRAIGRGVVGDHEVLGLHVSLLVTTGLMYGRSEPGIEELVTELGAFVDRTPALFLQGIQACSEAAVGQEAAARRRLVPWLGRLHLAFDGHEALPGLAAIAQVATRLRWLDLATEVADLLRPFAGMVPVGNGVPVDLSIDHHLADLALVAGDLGEALDHASHAVTFARRMRAPVLEARALSLLAHVTERAGDLAAAASARDAADTIAEPLGIRLPEPAPAATSGPQPTAVGAAVTGREVTLRAAHGRWEVTTPTGQAVVPDSSGMRQLARLVTAPGDLIAATELARTGARTTQAVVASDLGPALDGRAKREYRRRIAELQADIDEAEGNNDPERAAKHQLELEVILDELRAAVGLGGRDRPQGSSSERSRVNVARTIRRAIAAIGAAAPDLGAHLEVSIRTGHHCSYAPEPAAALTWVVTTDP